MTFPLEVLGNCPGPISATADFIANSSDLPAQTVDDRELFDIKAPMLGTFYASPQPGAPPFVNVGAVVDQDTVVGIIEVMKLMNAVRAGARGTVTQILGRDGALVEYGETLLRIARTS